MFERLKEVSCGKMATRLGETIADKKYKEIRGEQEYLLAQQTILIVGAGPGGLRMAIEAALLGFGRVVVAENRTEFMDLHRGLLVQNGLLFLSR